MLLAAALFSLVLVAVVGIDRTGREAFRKNEAESAAYRRAMLGIEHLKRELRGARLDTVDPGRLVVQVPLMEGDVPKVAASGEIVYSADPVEVALDGTKRLVATQAGQPPRVLTNLGPEGAVAFQRLESGLVRATLTAHVADRRTTGQSRYRVESDFFLPNQP